MDTGLKERSCRYLLHLQDCMYSNAVLKRVAGILIYTGHPFYLIVQLVYNYFVMRVFPIIHINYCGGIV